MYIHYCPAYEQLEVKVETLAEHINLSLRSTKTGNTFSITLSGKQVAVVASALQDVLTIAGEVEDRLNVFGDAVRIGKTNDDFEEREAA